MSLPTVAEARRRMLARIVPLSAEGVGCEAASGRVLRQDVHATRDQPPFEASAMDGWAVRKADADLSPAELLIVGESVAGRGWSGEVAAGQAVRISTGAPIPRGADWIVIQEEAERDGKRVRVGPLAGSSNLVRPLGSDFRQGDALLESGCRLDPWRVALAAAAGCKVLQVSRRPRVVIAPSGNEVVAPGTSPGPWQIYDSAGTGLAAWFDARGCVVETLKPLRDDRDFVIKDLSHVDCDLLVTIGGASVGDHDVVKPALTAMGLELIVEGVAVRPGKPTWFGLLEHGRRVLGLPGNPVSAMVCAELFGAGLIAAMEGDPWCGPIVRQARLASPIAANGNREHYMRASLSRNSDGTLAAQVGVNQDSLLVSVLASAGGLVRRACNAPSAEEGDNVDVIILDRAAFLDGS